MWGVKKNKVVPYTILSNNPQEKLWQAEKNFINLWRRAMRSCFTVTGTTFIAVEEKTFAKFDMQNTRHGISGVILRHATFAPIYQNPPYTH